MLGAPEPRARTEDDNHSTRCPNCGGLNPADADWCGQCHARFVPAPPKTDDEPAEAADEFASWLKLDPESAGAPTRDPSTSEPDFDPLADPFPVPANMSEPGPIGDEPKSTSTKPVERRSGAFAIAGDRISWTCSRCEADNPLESSVCEVCGASFADAVGSSSSETQRVARDPNMAAFVSLFYPGAGHAYLGMWGQAVARAALSTWVVAAAIFALIGHDAPGALFIGIVFALASFALWAVAAHDAFREAGGQSNQVLLKPRIFLYVTIALLFLLFSSLMMAGFSVARQG